MNTDTKDSHLSPSVASSPAVQLQGLQFAWSRSAEPLLDIPELTIERGERVFLFGPSGSGKTSLLNLLAGVSQPTQGRVEVLGQDLAALSARRRDRYRACHIGVVFQQFNLIPYLSVQENVCLAAHFARQAKQATERACDLLQALGLPEGIARRPAGELSVGQQQRVAVARALITRPEILLADEPSSSLDTDNRDAFLEVMQQQVAECNATLIFVSHDRGLARHFTRQLDMRDLTPAHSTAEEVL